MSSAPPRLHIGIVGASGETGTSIVNGLLEAGNFDVTALIRPSSLTKPSNLALKDRGVHLAPVDLFADVEDIAASLKGVDILISAIAPTEAHLQIPLATAAKAANVQRFLPCAYAPHIPPGGNHILIDQKEKVYQHVKNIDLPYTIVDVGWWFQLCVPKLPSGRTDYVQLTGEANTIIGKGDVPSALTDLRDIGRYVATIVADERTVNKYVFVWGEMWTQMRIFECVERISGESIERRYISEGELMARIEGIGGRDEVDIEMLAMKVPVQYQISLYVRGDNQPEKARDAGYLLGKELYPDLEARTFEAYVEEVFDGKAKGVYEGRYEDLKKHFKNGK